MESDLSSKVTVEYHDPSGIFPLISRDLASRLPLRNLNWKSPSRPLRSIGALHVEFVPDAQTEASESDKLQRVDSYGSRPGAATVAKERRHQIPGLRQTPYLRIYLLRCDDKDTYKASSRQMLRDWLRETALPAQSSSAVNRSEDHDAAEWLILHVVIPDTIAASEPRWTAASKKEPDELVERPSSTTKWPGKNSRTVLDKIRADFTASSKSGPERIAQIRLQKKDVPPQLLPQTPVTQPYTESLQEQDNAWQDLIAKFKTLILMSFDLRVLQYEDDIREKGSQRALPGWNFCTFFTLKEGLARGFESVGLVEDALAIYDELSVGLDSVLRENEPGATQGTFLGDLDTQRKALLETIDAQSDTSRLEQLTSQFQELFSQPLDLTKKDYRGAIVSSTISLFDFRLYIFARQRTLLLRLGAGIGNLQQTKPSSARASPKDDNLTFAAEVCKRAALFAATNSRALRSGLTDGSEINSLVSSLVENIASSWTHAVLEQVLEETASKDLSLSGDKAQLTPQFQTLGVFSKKEAGGNFNFPQGANTHPARSSSLQRSASSSSQLTPQTIYENDRYAKSTPSAQPDTMSTIGSGIAVLASGRAQLLLMQRRIIEALAKQKGWQSGWAAIKEPQAMVDIDLDGEEETGADLEREALKASTSTAKIEKITNMVLSAPLSSALASLEEFRAVYEQLSKLAMSHFSTANHTKSADSVMSDLAILKYQLGDVAQAATYFQRSSATFLKTSWSYVHGEMLRIYAKCLKDLHRRDEYMRVMLSLLGKVVAHRTAKSLPRIRGTSAWLDEETVDVTSILEELVSFSGELPYNFNATMSEFFANINVSPEIMHYSGKDGFSLNVHFTHLLDEDLILDRVKLRLVLVSDGSQEILLQSDGPLTLKRGLAKLQVHSSVTTYGHYLIDKLTLESKKLHFSHEFQPKPQTTPLGITNANMSGRRPSMSGPSLLVYPHGKSLEIRTTLANEIHIDKIRSIELTVVTGRNNTESLDLRLKSASAGLRLHTADAAIIESDHAHLDTSQAGTLRLGAAGSEVVLKIRVPYSTERALDELIIKLEANYQTSQGLFSYLRTSAVSAALPLDVDVNDIFKSHALFSRFSIRTTNATPLQVTNVQVQESEFYGVRALPCPLPMTVFDKQPANLTYKVTRKDGQGELNKKEAALSLTVEYIRSDEAIFEKLGETFEQAVASSPFAALRRLLVPTLLNRTKSYAPAHQLEQAVLLNEFQVPSYGSMGWERLVASLTSDMRQGLELWLQEWHSNNHKLPLDQTKPAASSRKITLSVEVPTVDVLHTVTLRLDDSRAAEAVIIGRPLAATLTIKHTRRWASVAVASDTPLSFSYDVDASADGPWLVAGPKRSRFDLKPDDEETKVSLVLVPLRLGMHLLPSIDIQSVALAVDDSGSNGMSRLLSPGQNNAPVEEETTQPLVSCETDYHNSGETVMVVRETRTTTVTVRERDLMPALQRMPTATESGGARTALVLVIAATVSFIGKAFWQKIQQGGEQQQQKKKTGKNGKRKRRSQGGSGFKEARHENYDPEVGNASFFDD
ncbi:hypothetical protein AUEXF2481DRAFT_1718 [Aureobasidium subglaciale EXF-2481]|uniref:Trafficking protein particle complex subunit 11 domain-containing protein n=1 Tax=Aureobasidium subglaciale (strain EXF-2481) TaxID=1043005 RepID=A0A074YXI3_AURSE|nr:uncharacterized protein AUEXF2481DRAFT_1718 [Aureobasidium subglaciale EXF-2481]KEQ98887.1 hypothetical protein AUEXF2481DRAFT_1718 [Aureobasidium subglaciale EXF-2481]